MKIGILPLGRPTFDVPYAEERLAAMLARLDETGHEIVGPRGLLFDADATKAAFGDLQAVGVDQVLLLQVTFTDASMTVEAASARNLSIWAVPGRVWAALRLNAFCGLNLASHALGLNDRAFGLLYADPEGDVAEDLAALLERPAPVGRCRLPRPRRPAPEAPRAEAAALAGLTRWIRRSWTAPSASRPRWTGCNRTAPMTPSPSAAGQKPSPNMAARCAAPSP